MRVCDFNRRERKEHKEPQTERTDHLTTDSSRWVAKECRNVCGVTRLFSGALRAAWRMAFWKVASSRRCQFCGAVP